MAHVVSLDVDENMEVALNGFFVATDDPVELVTDDAVTNDVVAAIGLLSERTDMV